MQNIPVHLETVAVEARAGDAATPHGQGVFRLQQGPWGLDNAHPSSSLVLSLPPSLGGGVIIFSYAAILALGDQGLRGRLATGIVFTAAAPVGDVPLSHADKTRRCFAFLAGACCSVGHD